MDWREKVFKDFTLCVVTDLKAAPDAMLQKIEQAYRGGADIVQLRSKVLPDAVMIRFGLKMRKIATRYRKLFFVNDRVDLALATDADGVHLGQEDMPQKMAIKIVRQAAKRLWIGRSTHTMSQALKAEKEGADYIGFGPVFLTPTKPSANAVGLKLVCEVSDKVRIPCVAIGGIDLQNIQTVIAAGASRVAVVRAVLGAKDPEKAAQFLKKSLKG